MSLSGREFHVDGAARQTPSEFCQPKRIAYAAVHDLVLVAAQGIFIWGYSPGVLGDESLLVGSRSKAPMGLGDECPPETEAVCRHCLQIFTAETIKI